MQIIGKRYSDEDGHMVGRELNQIFEEQEKRIKYNDLVANAVIFQNVVDITLILWDLIKEGYKFSREELVMLSPYLTRHIKRFGDYVIDLQNIPQPVEENIPV